MKKMIYLLFALFIANSAFAQNVTVNFEVDMSIKAKKAQFTPGTDAVKIAGNFNGWNNGADVLDDANNDSVYTIAIDTFEVGDTLYFKFIKGADQWEDDPNREYVVQAGTNTVHVFFNRDSVYSPAAPVAFTFNVDMELEVLSGRFDPASDTVSVNGSFNGWATNVDRLTPNPLNPNVYSGIVTTNVSEGETIQYKYWYTENNWESIENRTYTVTAADLTAGAVELAGAFNNGTLDDVLNQRATVKFTVNTNGATSAISGGAFPVVNTVHIAGSQLPLRWPAGGWPDNDTVIIQLFDDGTHGDFWAGDKIFTTEVTFPAYTLLTVQYKYAINWGDAANNGGGNDNEAGFGANHTLVMEKFLTSATTVDTFGVMDTTDLVDVVTGVEEIAGVTPQVYELGQNYPNPFNPATVINFNLPEAGFVTLRIYNLLGEEVASLVNEFKNSGAYKVGFDASQLNSGVYFYTIKSGNFTATKKMMLVK